MANGDAAGSLTAKEEETLVTSEYTFLRTEIADSLKESANLEKLIAGSTGAIWAWLFVQPQVPALAWWMPLPFVILAGLRARTLYTSITMVSEYLSGREKKCADQGSQGGRWEAYRAPLTSGVHRTAKWFWFGLTAVVLAVALWATLLRSPAKPPIPPCCACAVGSSAPSNP